MTDITLFWLVGGVVDNVSAFVQRISIWGLNLVKLVQAIGLMSIGGGIVAAIAAFHFRSPATAAT